jgi:hypothetical protein
MDTDKPAFDVVESIGKHIKMLKSWFPKQAIVCIGDYPIKIFLKGSFAEETVGALPILIDKSSEDIAKWSQSRVESYNILGLDMNIDTHFLFNVLPHIAKDDALIERLKNKPFEKIAGALVVSSLWDGVGSACLPTLIYQLKKWNIDSVALALLPSKVQTSDAHFNAFSSVGILASEDFTTVVLIDRDQLESYVGVDRNGSVMKGNVAINYILETMLAKETLVQELSELSRSFNIKMYTVLSATGASLEIYDSLENILNTTLLQPFLKFDLSSASVLYVVVRLPIQLKDKFSRGKIELEIGNWLKDKASLQSIFVSEPIYAEDVNDRIDVVMFVGGFDTSELFTRLKKKTRLIRDRAIKQGLIKEKEWQSIFKIMENFEDNARTS